MCLPFRAQSGGTYDDSTNLFSNFVVSWDGFTFDLTTSANSHSGQCSAISIMLQTCAGGDWTWQGATVGFPPPIAQSVPRFQFLPPVEGEQPIIAFAPPCPTACFGITDGTFQVENTAPEPLTISLLAIGLAGFGRVVNRGKWAGAAMKKRS